MSAKKKKKPPRSGGRSKSNSRQPRRTKPDKLRGHSGKPAKKYTRKSSGIAVRKKAKTTTPNAVRKKRGARSRPAPEKKRSAKKQAAPRKKKAVPRKKKATPRRPRCERETGGAQCRKLSIPGSPYCSDHQKDPARQRAGRKSWINRRRRTKVEEITQALAPAMREYTLDELYEMIEDKMLKLGAEVGMTPREFYATLMGSPP